jgi:hypothetical protein
LSQLYAVEVPEFSSSAGAFDLLRLGNARTEQHYRERRAGLEQLFADRLDRVCGFPLSALPGWMFLPSCAARIAATYPLEPAPRTLTS